MDNIWQDEEGYWHINTGATQPDAASYIQGMIRQLDRSDRRYNCECQVGGVDAMSVDTDWLLNALRRAKLLVLREADRG